MGEESGSCEVVLVAHEGGAMACEVLGSRFIISPSQAPPLACFIIALKIHMSPTQLIVLGLISAKSG